MRKKYIITQEEFEAIKEAIKNALELWNYSIIEAHDSIEPLSGISMKKETFFELLKREFIIEDEKRIPPKTNKNP